MDQIQRQVAEMAIRLLAMPADALRNDPETLADVELLATQILKEIHALRAGRTYLPGEQSGMWRALKTGT